MEEVCIGPKSKIEAPEARQAVSGWLNQLSDEQSVAIAPLLQALSNLMSGYEPSSKEQAARVLPAPGAYAAAIGGDALQYLEENLSQALELDTAEALKESIAMCLEVVRTEKANQVIVPRVQAPAGPATLDAETGLPGRLLFERIVADFLAEGRNFIIALFVVERLPLINKRFGRAAGDRVLLYVAQYLAQDLPDSNSLSRWSGSAFASIINAENSDKMESHIRAISNKPLSANIDVGTRSVMLTISCACMMEQLAGNSSPERLFEKLDNFVASRSGT